MSIATLQNLPFRENKEKRIQSVCSLLDASLGHCFVDALQNRDDNAVFYCLCAYVAIDNTRNAEEMVRSIIVMPLLKKAIPQSSSRMHGGESGYELEEDYKKIIHFIEEDCKFLLEVLAKGMLIHLSLYIILNPRFIIDFYVWCYLQEIQVSMCIDS